MITPRKYVVKVPKTRILAIPDTHCPFQSDAAMNAVIKLTRKLKPTVIVQLGDWADFFAVGNHWDHSLDVTMPGTELKAAKKTMGVFWKRLQAAAPKATCYQLLGNHPARIQKAVLRSLPEAESLVDESFIKYNGFPRVVAFNHEKDELIMKTREFGAIHFIHGYLSKSTHFLERGQNVVRGHSHRAGIFYANRNDKTIFEMECGALVDDRCGKPAFAYKQSVTSTWQASVGFIDSHGPRVILVGGAK